MIGTSYRVQKHLIEIHLIKMCFEIIMIFNDKMHADQLIWKKRFPKLHYSYSIDESSKLFSFEWMHSQIMFAKLNDFEKWVFHELLSHMSYKWKIRINCVKSLLTTFIYFFDWLINCFWIQNNLVISFAIQKIFLGHIFLKNVALFQNCFFFQWTHRNIYSWKSIFWNKRINFMFK